MTTDAMILDDTSAAFEASLAAHQDAFQGSNAGPGGPPKTHAMRDARNRRSDDRTGGGAGSPVSEPKSRVTETVSDGPELVFRKLWSSWTVKRSNLFREPHRGNTLSLNLD